jgi:hypothetical protein
VLKDLVDREVSFEDEVAAVLDLVDGVSAAQVDGLAIFFRKLGAEEPTPVVQSFFDDGGAQLVGGRLQCFRICRRQEGVVVFAKSHSLAAEFNLHEVVSVQVIRGLKGKVRADAHGQRTDHRVTDVEVVMQNSVTGRAG